MDEPEEDKKVIRALDSDDIALLKTYGLGPYASRIKAAEQSLKDVAQRVNDICGIKESDTGLSAPSRWDLVSDKQAQQEEQPLQVTIRFTSGTPVPPFCHPTLVWLSTLLSLEEVLCVMAAQPRYHRRFPSSARAAWCPWTAACRAHTLVHKLCRSRAAQRS